MLTCQAKVEIVSTFAFVSQTGNLAKDDIVSSFALLTLVGHLAMLRFEQCLLERRSRLVGEDHLELADAASEFKFRVFGQSMAILKSLQARTRNNDEIAALGVAIGLLNDKFRA